jgi:hypothetical protein
MLSAVDAPSGISPREELAPAVLSNLTGSEAARRGPHHLLVVEGDECRLLALCVRPRGAAGVAVSVSCVRTAATAEAGPRFTSMLWVQVPAPVSALPDGKGRRLMMEAEVASCAVPGEMVLYSYVRTKYTSPELPCSMKLFLQLNTNTFPCPVSCILSKSVQIVIS